MTMQEKAKKIVADYMKCEAEDIYVVWFCKTLQNWKAILSTDIVKGYLFEVTYNGDKNEAYLDAYTKEKNVVVREGLA